MSAIGAFKDDRGEIAYGFLVQHAGPDQHGVASFEAARRL